MSSKEKNQYKRIFSQRHANTAQMMVRQVAPN